MYVQELNAKAVITSRIFQYYLSAMLWSYHQARMRDASILMNSLVVLILFRSFVKMNHIRTPAQQTAQISEDKQNMQLNRSYPKTIIVNCYFEPDPALPWVLFSQIVHILEAQQYSNNSSSGDLMIYPTILCRDNVLIQTIINYYIVSACQRLQLSQFQLENIRLCVLKQVVYKSYQHESYYKKSLHNNSFCKYMTNVQIQMHNISCLFHLFFIGDTHQKQESCKK
ncbi:Hypothetical_protein [Hexamita inflata]|uniref:Hypothetical_protein n=1 Tax=Hexamita inflata TaxID=28002 RepID=A0AA86Q1B8_9EUKA|nr:Hypothetical protein HINF_LOCUS37850 [Hexamita inflata]